MLARRLAAAAWLICMAAFLAACSQQTAGSARSENNGDSGDAPAIPAGLEAAFVPVGEGGNKFIAVADLVAALDAGMDIVIVDARPQLDYDFGHIPSAVNVPYFDVESHMDQLPKDQWIVTYCECPHAEAEQAADVLLANGFTHVKVIDEGLLGWRELGGDLTDS